MLQCRNYCKSISLPLMVFTRLCLDRQVLYGMQKVFIFLCYFEGKVNKYYRYLQTKCNKKFS